MLISWQRTVIARASQYEEGFNPSSFTALGGFVGIKAAISHVWQRDNFHGLRVAIQGLGATGADIARQLHEAGASLVVADINDEAVNEVVSRYNATAVAPEVIHAQDVDIFAPCAMGAILNNATIPEIKAKIICGLANNQLAEARHGVTLQEKGIIYVPDYVVNAGGMMGASTVIFDKPSREKSISRIYGLFDTIKTILKQSDDTGNPSSDVADEIAKSRIAKAANLEG